MALLTCLGGVKHGRDARRSSPSFDASLQLCADPWIVLALYRSDIDVCPPGNPPPWTPSLVPGYQGRGLLDLVGYDLVFFAADLACHVMAPPGSLTCLSTVS
jgi:hypothetical protein